MVAQVNSVNPAWVRPLLSAYNPQAQQPVKIVIYDVDRLKDGDTRKINLDSQDYIGAPARVDQLARLFASPCCC